MYVYITRLRRWGSGYNNDKKNPIEDYNAKSILRRRFPQVNRNSLNFQAVKMEKNKTPERKCTTKEFRLKHLFGYMGNRVQELATKSVASGEVVSSHIIWIVNCTTCNSVIF